MLDSFIGVLLSISGRLVFWFLNGLILRILHHLFGVLRGLRLLGNRLGWRTDQHRLGGVWHGQ